MSHLGSFGAAAKELDPNAEKDDFTFFDEKFFVVGTVPQMLMLQLGAALTGKIDDQEGLGAMWEAMRTALTVPERETVENGAVRKLPEDDEQFRRFYRLAVQQKCEIEELLKLASALMEAQSGRPTGEPHGSSPGPTSTSPNVNTSSSTHPALQGMTPVSQLVHG